jgi:uncharacterized membrane protein YeaQ/YmgE (transglycosylase-associated protein family)
MIGMHFGAFLSLLIVSLIAAGVVHYALQYRFLEGLDGFFAKWIVGWIGAWMASPVLGYWFESLKVDDVYVIPALLGGFMAVFMSTAVLKTVAMLAERRAFVETRIRSPREIKAA